MTPHLVAPTTETVPEQTANLEHLALITAALGEVVHGPTGTARRISRMPMAGKTGTAQVARLQEGIEADELPPELRHHAWFVGWAPLEDPELVVAVIVEHGGDGGSVAAPVAARVVEAHLEKTPSRADHHPAPPPYPTPDLPRPAGSAG